ncbi:MAG: 3-dehydroquinate synthase [Gemmatimonadaceae bacterium]
MTTQDTSPRVIDLLGYQIQVGPWLLDDVGRVAGTLARAHTFAVITDENVGPIAAPQCVGSLRHFAPHSRVILRSIPAGEAEKTRESWTRLTDWLLEEHCGRDTTIIALGGGVIGDLAGFVAATFMRGVPFVQVPTSLLAMVDASVGGKVGVDTRHGKNLVGAFHQPAAVVIDPTVLQTLPREHLRAGFAEVLKHGIIADASYLATAVRVGAHVLTATSADVAWHGEEMTDLVATSVRLKAAVVANDERERGLRQILNFGHTVGHALEVATDFDMLHGEAIAIGMCVEARLADRVRVSATPIGDTIRESIETLGLPARLPSSVTPQQMLDCMRLDKKARAGTLVFALPRGIGVMANPERGIEVEARIVEDVLREG